MNKRDFLKKFGSTILALGVVAFSNHIGSQTDSQSNDNKASDKQSKQTSDDTRKGMEKCYGVVKAGKNQCAAHNHSCEGQATKSGDPDEWIFMPEGLCTKLVGGSLKAGKSNKTG